MAKISRRRFIKISAISISLPFLPNALNAKTLEKTAWSGVALGAKASMTLMHEESSFSKKSIEVCIKEVRRLEGIFSLMDSGSSISLLNKQGFIANPPKELLEVLKFAQDISQNSNGAFDVTVQPLWSAYETFFAQEGEKDMHELHQAIDEAQKLVSYKRVLFNKKEISFEQKGMKITLNAIAQGYITDTITNILKERGFENVLVDLGEISSIGGYDKKRDWNIATPYLQDKKYITLNNNAVASSGGYGTRFDEKHHHLFNPKTGESANLMNSVTVVAPNAMLADALSTAVFVMPKDRNEELKSIYPEATIYIS